MESVTVKIEGADEVMRKLKKLDKRLSKRIIKKVGRKALKPMVDSYRTSITKADEVFKVYYKGTIRARILPGQLRRSIGIKSPKALSSKNVIGMSVGPRRSKTFGSAEKGGWYAGMINFGWLRLGANQEDNYSGKNLGFAQRAQKRGKGIVGRRFEQLFTAEVNSEIKKLKFGQRIGMR